MLEVRPAEVLQFSFHLLLWNLKWKPLEDVQPQRAASARRKQWLTGGS